MPSAALAAQTNNHFEINSGCSNYTDRGPLGINAGEMLVQVHKDYFAGVGHDAAGTGASIAGFRFVTQDERPATQETYFMVIRAATTAGAPVFPGPPLVRGGPLTTPVSTSITPLAWQVTATFVTPATIPLCDTYFMGGELAAAPLWNNPPGTDDGQSFHIATYYPLGGTQGDNPAPNATNLAWVADFVTQTASQPTYANCIEIGTLVPSPILNTGNVDPTTTVACLVAQGGESFGAGGLWPACGIAGGRRDGLNVRVRDAASANGLFVLLLGARLGCPGVPLRGLGSGALYLNPAALATVGVGNLDAMGNGTIPVLPPNAPCPFNRFTPLQAFTISSALTLPGAFSNLAVTRYLR